MKNNKYILIVTAILLSLLIILITNNDNKNLTPAEKIAKKYCIHSEQDLENLGQELTILSDAVRLGKIKLK